VAAAKVITLPHRLAVATLAARLSDLSGATTVLGEPYRFARRST
jgi:ATP-dependent Lhr-like helicase